MSKSSVVPGDLLVDFDIYEDGFLDLYFVVAVDQTHVFFIDFWTTEVNHCERDSFDKWSGAFSRRLNR